MMFEDKFHVGLFVYAFVSIVLFVYALPFIYVGYSPYHDIPLAVNPTVLSNSDLPREEYPQPTKIALWFAEQRSARLFVTIILVVSLFVSHVLKINSISKKLVCHLVMWIGMVAFILNYLGLLVYLVCI